jgi:hypothetical protein
VAVLVAGAVRVGDGALKVVLGGTTVVRVEGVLLVAVSVRPVLRNYGDELDAEEEVRVQLQIVDVSFMKQFMTQGFRTRAREETVMEVISVVPALRAPLHDVVADVIKTFAGPQSVGQVPVKKPPMMWRKPAVQEDGPRGLKFGDVHAVVRDVDAGPRPCQVQPVPVEAQTVSQKCGSSVRQVEEGAVGVDELEGGRKRPAHPP